MVEMTQIKAYISKGRDSGFFFHARDLTTTKPLMNQQMQMITIRAYTDSILGL
jgi:hypothetical protein